MPSEYGPLSDTSAVLPVVSRSPQMYPNLLEAMQLPQLIQVEKNLIAAAFTLMKLLPAKYVVEKALKEKRITAGSTIVETSSGSYALGLAMACATWGLKFHIYSDPGCRSFPQKPHREPGGHRPSLLPGGRQQ